MGEINEKEEVVDTASSQPEKAEEVATSENEEGSKPKASKSPLKRIGNLFTDTVIAIVILFIFFNLKSTGKLDKPVALLDTLDTTAWVTDIYEYEQGKYKVEINYKINKNTYEVVLDSDKEYRIGEDIYITVDAVKQDEVIEVYDKN